MTNKKHLIFLILVTVSLSVPTFKLFSQSESSGEVADTTTEAKSRIIFPELEAKNYEITTIKPEAQVETIDEKIPPIRQVPFYSQFKDIASPQWQKVGCGVASLAMLIDYYRPPVSVESLLIKGRNDGAYLESAGWTHAGLINLAKPYDLTGSTVSLSHLSMENAVAELKTVLEEGPVMASVHYTFEPTNPIPHLVVINEVKDGLVYYNDPAEIQGGNSITLNKFKLAWKKRYISIRPAS